MGEGGKGVSVDEGLKPLYTKKVSNVHCTYCEFDIFEEL